MANTLTTELENTGIVIIPNLLSAEQLQGMQVAFKVQLKRMRWNNFDGYERTERYRHMIQDVLTLDQGFLDSALHPVVIGLLREYLGDAFELVEAKGWKSLPTKRDFHGWHGDAWYDQNRIQDLIPREVKLGIYLTDVKTGGFVYVKGTHRRQHPRTVRSEEVGRFPPESLLEVTGPAGLAFAFDTSGIHRQKIPILEPRQAVFFAYHDPRVPLQQEDMEYYRYHPLQLNAAFLGQVTKENQRILGFGNKTNFRPAYERQSRHTRFQSFLARSFAAKMRFDELYERVRGKLSNLGIAPTF